MQVSSLNEVKIYSLSCGKSLPEWLSDRKKRALQKKDVDVRRRIELIQDFEMPTVCTTIKVSKDGQYILATGTYKPRVRCYDTYQLSLKFERCLDSEVVTFETLSDDYSKFHTYVIYRISFRTTVTAIAFGQSNIKIVFLHNDRYIEFHSQSGFYYKTRIPKFGRDFSYHYPSCDLYFVGASSEVYRLNLEQGRYLNPLQTDAAENNVCDINAAHGLFAAGTIEGRVECWDPRTRSRVGLLDCALSSVTADSEINSLPTISALKFNGALTMAVGTSTGQVLLYDLRSDKPLLVKDHQYGLPIRSVHFQDSLDLILSADSRIIKMWNKNSGKIFTSLEPEHDINDVCLYPNSGMLLTANETPKMGVYYIPTAIKTHGAVVMGSSILSAQGGSSESPSSADTFNSTAFPLSSIVSFGISLDLRGRGGVLGKIPINSKKVLGPAPRWCSFLDNLTEELEENPESTVYDDYKFVTKKDLENLGLTHLIGSPFLRAYMHGFFMDIRLYHKVKLMVNPFAYEEYRRDKIRQKIEETRAQRVQLKKLPKVNKELALKLIEEEEEKQKSTWKKKVKDNICSKWEVWKIEKNVKNVTYAIPPPERHRSDSLPNILTDDRFKVMFENPDFQVDEESEEFRLLNPLVSKISEKRKKKLRLLEQRELREKEEEEEPEGKPSDAESSESSDDEKGWVEEVRKQRRLLLQEEKLKRRERLREDQQTVLQPQFYEIKAGEEFRSFRDSATKQKLMNKTLEDRLKLEAKSGALSVSDTTVGSKQLTFTLKRSEQQKQQQEAEKRHRQERKTLRRSAGHLKSRPRRGRPFH